MYLIARKQTDGIIIIACFVAYIVEFHYNLKN